jgi:hypothetical protein
MTKPKAKIKPETRALNPCPFCGGDAHDVVICSSSDEYWFMCEECHCQGPLGETKRDAKILWNGRD